jgi:hypothetical protein
VGVRVDQSGQDRSLREVDHFGSGRNLDLSCGSNFGDSLTRKKHYLSRQHLSGFAVEQAAGPDGD